MGASMPVADAEAEVAELLSTLIRFDTSNPGGPERAAAEWVAERLDEVGVSARIYEAAPGRASLVARIEGEDRSLPPLLVQGHLDVVPADPSQWRHHPFGGEIVDGWVWGRGAVDMKDMVAMMLALVRSWARARVRPSRDLVVAFLADEEAGGRAGSHFVVDRHADLVADCRQAIGEVGGFSVAIAEDRRVYLIQTAEKGLGWLRATASGMGGHGSMVHDDNAVAMLARAIARVGTGRSSVTVTPPMAILAERVGAALGIDVDPDQPDTWLPRLGLAARMIGAALQTTVNPTGLTAGCVVNTVPTEAEATLDVRWLPGEGAAVEAELRERLGPQIELEWLVRAPSVEAPVSSPLVEAMESALVAEDRTGVPAPYLMSAGTDAKAFDRLGIECYGFVPLRLPPALDFTALFHGVDERVPVDAVQFGVRVLDRMLRSRWEDPDLANSL
jgi:acetylornithine deacetylase/succinyl-diaminopimelate desuccinylase-like protein